MFLAYHKVFISLTFIVNTLQHIRYARYVKIQWFYDLR